MSNEISLSQSIATGTVAAIAEATINHPLWAFKLRQQSNKPFTIDPRILYRGFPAHVISRIPTTSLQMMGSYYFKDNVFSTIDSQPIKAVLSALAGGALAAVLQTPVELTMTYQHKYSQSFSYQIQNIYATHGLSGLGTGYLGTAIRLGGYTCSFFAVQPLVKNKLEKDYNISGVASHISSSVLTGALSTLASNPADVIKTHQQDQLPQQKLNALAATKDIFRKRGPYGFFDGSLSRFARVSSGIGIISFVNATMNPQGSSHE